MVRALGHPALVVTYGPYGPTSVPIPPVTYTYTLYWNLTDARLTNTTTPTAPLCSGCYNLLITNMTPWYFTAGKSFTIYIANASDVYYWTSSGWQLGQPVTMTATATANSTGGVTWTVSTTLSNGITPSQVYANWTVVIVLNNYGGGNWMVFNVTTVNSTLASLMNNLTNVNLSSYLSTNGTPLTWQQIEQAVSSGATLYLVPVFENTFSIQRTVTATEAIESFTLTNILTTANIVVVLSSFGPAPGVTLSYSVSEPECPIKITQVSPAMTTVGYVYSVTPLMPSPSVCKPVTAVTGSGTTNAQGQITTATFVTPVAPFAAQVTITVQSWKGISLGYTYYVTSSNATTPIQVSVPAVELTVTPVSASGAPLTTEATVNITCSGVPIASGVGQQTVVVPIPSGGSITCTINGYSYGKSASTTVTLTSSQAGQTITKTLTIPVSGYYIPGVGFVPTSTFILLAVVIIIIIILIVILLIEYSNWRRRRLAGLLGPPK